MIDQEAQKQAVLNYIMGQLESKSLAELQAIAQPMILREQLDQIAYEPSMPENGLEAYSRGL